MAKDANRERLRTHGFKWNLEHNYLSPPEEAEFKRLKRTGAITVFRLVRCLACGEDVPKVEDNGQLIKIYCSKKCHDEHTTPPEDEEDEEEDDDEHEDDEPA